MRSVSMAMICWVLSGCGKKEGANGGASTPAAPAASAGPTSAIVKSWKLCQSLGYMFRAAFPNAEPPGTEFVILGKPKGIADKRQFVSVSYPTELGGRFFRFRVCAILFRPEATPADRAAVADVFKRDVPKSRMDPAGFQPVTWGGHPAEEVTYSDVDGKMKTTLRILALPDALYVGSVSNPGELTAEQIEYFFGSFTRLRKQ